MSLQIFNKSKWLRAVLAGVLALGMAPAVHAQAINTATVSPPATGVTNSGASCTDPRVFNPSTGGCSSTDTDTILRPTLTQTKAGVLNMNVVAPNGVANVGDRINYTITVSNTGDGTATNVSVSDPKIATLTCTIDGAAVTLPTNIAAGKQLICAGAYTLTQADITAGSVSNTATITGANVCKATDPACTATTTTPITRVASYNMVKTSNTATISAPGTITYTFTFTNLGNVALSNLTVTDPTINSGSLTGCPIATLPVGSTTASCTATRTVTQAMIDAGTAIVNTATPSATGPAGTTPTETTTTDNTTSTTVTRSPAMTVVKTANPTSLSAPGTITYTIVVDNTGNVGLTGVTVGDSLTGGANGSAVTLTATRTAGDTDNDNVLDVTETWTYEATYSATQADIDSGVTLTNTASVTTTQITTPVTDDATTTLTQSPAMTVVKQANKAVYAVVGEEILYTYTLTNTGNVTINSLSVTDDILGAISNCSPTSITPAGHGTSVSTCTATHSVTQADLDAGSITNVATGNGTPTVGTLTPPEATVTVTALSQTLSKALTNNADGDASGTVSLGDVLTYTVTVTNTSASGSLTNVVVSDPKIAPSTITCPSVSVGATCVLTGTYTVTAADVTAGSISNTAVATSPVCPVGSTDPDCITTVVTPIVPTIDAVDDNFANAPITGSAGGTTLSVIGNDTTNSLAPVIGSNVTLNNTGTAQGGTTALGLMTAPATGSITMNPDGTITVAPGTTAGTYTYTYEICSLPATSPSTCDTAVATIVVAAAPIDAVNDTFGPVNGVTGNPNAGNALTNDTLNGQPVTIDQVALTLTTPATSINGGPVPSLNPATGVVSVPAGTPAGDYTIAYQICEALNPTNCDTATVTVTVAAAAIDAVNDTGTTTSTGGVAVPNVLVNDTLNGQPATLTNAILTQVSTTNPGVTLDSATGAVNVAPGTPAGTVTVTYQICEVLNPTNCDTATVTVTVTAAIIVANPDEGNVTVVDGGVAVPNVLVNDTLGGQAVNLNQVAITVTSPASDSRVVLDPATGVVTVAPGTPEGTYQIGYQICERANPTNCAATRVVITVTGEVSSMRVTKTATPRDVKVGDLVRYTLVIENTGANRVVDATVVDTPPAGFSYVDGSLTVADSDGAGRLVGKNPLSVDGIDIAIGGRATVVYIMRVGAGVRPGAHVNQAKMVDNGVDSSNVATAEVQVVGDPLMDDSLIVGTVFGDRDGDGWQDSAAVSGMKVQGGFAPAAYIANSTTVDRGNGAQPEPDASSPMLHGIALGNAAARQSDADPIAAHTMVIRQKLASLDFTNDFVLSNDQGYSVRMNAAGETTVEKSGDAAKGVSGAELQVERKVAQVDGGYQVDYIVRNVGVDERGLPGVRIASVEGLLVETDQFGRYHMAGIAGGPTERGRNFILKVDPATLPPGTRFTTDNPLVRRVTPGLPVRFDFGVKVPQEVIEGGEKHVEMDLGEVIFVPGQAAVRTEYQPVIDRLATEIRSRGAGEIVIEANGDSHALAFDRARAVQDKLIATLDPALASALKITLRTQVDDARTNLVTLGETPVLGMFLFDTDKAVIKPEFSPLIDKIAADIEALASKGGHTVIAVVGHADRRGSREYNQALGLRRAKAVFDALSAKLSPATKDRLRVDIDNSLTAPTGLHSGSR